MLRKEGAVLGGEGAGEANSVEDLNHGFAGLVLLVAVVGVLDDME